jgi:hypothetical protein
MPAPGFPAGRRSTYQPLNVMNQPPFSRSRFRGRRPLFTFTVLGLVLLAGRLAAAAPAFGSEEAMAFTDKFCSSCHNDIDKDGGLDLTSAQFSLSDPASFGLWVKAYDRVQSGEMPPKEKKRPAGTELSGFLQGLGGALTATEEAAAAVEGRSARRRLNRTEYENALRDLLHAPWLQVKDQLPEDGEAFRFNKVSQALDVSYVHMARYMAAADYALRQALTVAFNRPETRTTRYYFRDDSRLLSNLRGQRFDREKFLVLGTKAQPGLRAQAEQRDTSPEDPGVEVPLSAGDADPATRELEAVGWVSSNYVTGFDSRWNNFRAPVTGRYRLRFSGYTLWVGANGTSVMTNRTSDRKQVKQGPFWFRPNFDDVSEGRRDEPIIVYAQGGPANRRVGSFDLTPEPAVRQLDEVWLIANEVVVTDAARFYRSRPTGYQGGFTNPLAQPDGAPAVAFRWMEVEGPLYDENTTAGYRLLFGDLPMKQIEPGIAGVAIEPVAAFRAGRGGRGGSPAPGLTIEVETSQPRQDAERLLRAFMARAYRRPVPEDEVQRFLDLIQQRLDAGLGFAGAMVAGYTAVLASPEFVSIDEPAGRLDDNALATRLALFLWNSEPDAALRERAARRELHRPEVLRAEAERLLTDPKSGRFVNAFLDYWIEVRKMDDTTPSTVLYNDYYLDDALTEAALAETRLFFGDLVARDMPARNVVDSRFTFLNERLAEHYGVPGVKGVAMRRVELPSDSPRGGLMTQASVLKVTANGTSTSPIIRGKWIMERIAGFDMPAPPATVQLIEPDIRGATTLRQQLTQHAADESCAVCHRKIDPPGFALENFDVMGGWRDRYRVASPELEPVPGFGKNGWPFAFAYKLPVDASGQLPDGRAFKDIRDFKRLLLADEAQVARNVARHLAIYATGAPIRFSDREPLEKILRNAAAKEYGVRTLVHELIQSELFLNK